MNHIAVYGSLKRGYYNHSLIETQEFIGNGTVYGYQLYDLGYYPAAVQEKSEKELLVEVYSIENSIIFQRVDLMEIGAGYDRTIECIDIDGKIYPCWIYYFETAHKGWKLLPSNKWSE